MEVLMFSTFGFKTLIHNLQLVFFEGGGNFASKWGAVSLLLLLLLSSTMTLQCS